MTSVAQSACLALRVFLFRPLSSIDEDLGFRVLGFRVYIFRVLGVGHKVLGF